MECKDKHCFAHGSARTRGRAFSGTVIDAKMQATATVEWPRRLYVTKYERYETRRTKIKAHNPNCVDAKPGDIVRVVECRPMSKTKHFTIVEKIGREELFVAKKELLEASKVEQKEEEAHEGS